VFCRAGCLSISPHYGCCDPLKNRADISGTELLYASSSVQNGKYTIEQANIDKGNTTMTDTRTQNEIDNEVNNATRKSGPNWAAQAA